MLEEGDSVRVFHLDSGQVEVVDSVLLRLLPRCFGEFPMMAVPCCQTGSKMASTYYPDICPCMMVITKTLKDKNDVVMVF